MSDLTTRNQQISLSRDQLMNRRIGAWLSKLGTYLPQSKEFREKTPDYRAEFWAELVVVMAGAELPDEVWTTDAIRFCRRRFKFFPGAAELCDALNDYAEPMLAALRKDWERMKAESASSACKTNSSGGIPANEHSWLNLFRERAADGFTSLAEARGTNPREAKRSMLSLLRQQAPHAYKSLQSNKKTTS